MSNIVIKDGVGNSKYLKAGGTGVNEDPFIPVQDVNIQDQTSAPLILPMVQELAVDTLDGDVAIDEYTMDVVSVTGFEVGQHVRIINSAADRYYWGKILDITDLTITVDTPFDFVYVSGSEVTVSNTNLAVDGSVTPVKFILRTGSPSIPSAVDITRMIIVCEATNAVDLNKFGDLGMLDNGIVLRKINGDYHNIWNVKSNRDLVGLSFDWTPYEATHPTQGINGFSWRLTFGGQSKIGVVLRIEQDGNLELIIQDDLSDLISLICIVEGHVVVG